MCIILVYQELGKDEEARAYMAEALKNNPNLSLYGFVRAAYDQSSEFLVTEGEIANTRSYIIGSIADMESLLLDVDNNVPKEERYFRKIKDDRIRERCNFRKVCG